MKYIKRNFCIPVTAAMISLVFCACGAGKSEAEPLPTVTEAAPTETISVPSETIPPKAEPVETFAPSPEPAHSQFYLPGFSVEDVISYFNEVCLDAEFTDSGDSSVVQKWAVPVSYALYGSYTQEDVATLGAFVGWLNTLEGFPGMHEAQGVEPVNLRIHFCTRQEMLSIMGDRFAAMDGAVTFWYMNNEIYDAVICCLNNIDQKLRNSVILEEVYNGLGPVQDSVLRPDSIIAAEFSQPQSLTSMDQLIMKLLYHPEIKCGMDARECENVIRRLYY